MTLNINIIISNYWWVWLLTTENKKCITWPVTFITWHITWPAEGWQSRGLGGEVVVLCWRTELVAISNRKIQKTLYERRGQRKQFWCSIVLAAEKVKEVCSYADIFSTLPMTFPSMMGKMASSSLYSSRISMLTSSQNSLKKNLHVHTYTEAL